MIQLRINRYHDKDKEHLLRALKAARADLETLNKFGERVSDRVMNDFENVIKYLESIVEE